MFGHLHRRKWRQLFRSCMALVAVVGVFSLAVEPLLPEMHDESASPTGAVGTPGSTVPTRSDHHATHVDHCVHAHTVVMTRAETLAGIGDHAPAPKFGDASAMISVNVSPPVRPPIV